MDEMSRGTLRSSGALDRGLSMARGYDKLSLLRQSVRPLRYEPQGILEVANAMRHQHIALTLFKGQFDQLTQRAVCEPHHFGLRNGGAV